MRKLKKPNSPDGTFHRVVTALREIITLLRGKAHNRNTATVILAGCGLLPGPNMWLFLFNFAINKKLLNDQIASQGETLASQILGVVLILSALVYHRLSE